MTGVEVLAPLRLETRFVAPQDRSDGGQGWLLRVRMYPDDFSIRRAVPAPTPEELDRLAEAVASLRARPPVDERAAFASFSSVVGAGRAFALWRRYVADDGAGVLTVDRRDAQEREPFAAQTSVALPEELALWFVHEDGTREQAKTWALNRPAIDADLDIDAFRTGDGREAIEAGELPATWWLSYQRAKDVGLGVDLDVGATPPRLAALVVLGVGSDDAATLVDEHNAGGRLAVLTQGTPTNTVAGEPTTDFGDRADTMYPLLRTEAAEQPWSNAALTALTGRLSGDALPMLNGDAAMGWSDVVVSALWPVLWGRTLHDVVGAADTEIALHYWAQQYLAVHGPRPAIRVDAQPYGLLPTSAFGTWSPDPADPDAALEEKILAWTLPWRRNAAAFARAAAERVHDGDTRRLLSMFGQHAPTRRWRVRPVTELAVVQANRALAGMPPLQSSWNAVTARAWRQWPTPMNVAGPGAHTAPLPPPPEDMEDDPDALLRLIEAQPEELIYTWDIPMGLIGHLLRQSLICVRATIGRAWRELVNSGTVSLDTGLPVDDVDAYLRDASVGSDGNAEELLRSGDANAELIGRRYLETMGGMYTLVDRFAAWRDEVFRTVLAALDSASLRVDPWLTGVAEHRLQRMINDGAPFRVGAYGWVDAPTPYDPGSHRAALPPGPTTAGLLHAPSYAQALTAAVLRDAAIRHPGDDRWQLTIDSAKVRAAIALSERVRLGVHPYEALGLEVEKIAGDWDSVRILREKFAPAGEQQLRRVCNGQAVLAAARGNSLPPGLAPDLAERLEPLDEVLDTYADLLVADGVHAMVSGRADLANAAMEAAAGLGAPPELRAIHTPRNATEVRVNAWVLLPHDPAAGDAEDPLWLADPAFAAFTDGADVERTAALLGGGDDALAPSLAGAESTTAADAALRGAVLTDLTTRLAGLRARASADVATLDAVTLSGVAEKWCVQSDSADGIQGVKTILQERLTATETVPAASGPGSTGAAVPDVVINTVRRQIRMLAGRPYLPVLPLVDRSLIDDLELQRRSGLDREWLEIVAAVRPRMAALEAHQFVSPWDGYVRTPDGSTDPWHPDGPVLVAYRPRPLTGDQVAIAVLDAWTDSIPSRRHATTAAFGFNSPKARAPQAVLLAVPPDPSQRLDNTTLLDVVLETRELVHARAAGPRDNNGFPYATPTPLLHATESVDFLKGWHG